MNDMDKREQEYETREDVDRLLRADEVCKDKTRYSRAMGRLEGTVQRLKSKKKAGRSSGRSGGR